jgi:hypothetical protein
MLRSMGCDDGQGYLFGRPGSPQRLTEFCRDWDVQGQRTLAGLPRQNGAGADAGADEQTLTA